MNGSAPSVQCMGYPTRPIWVLFLNGPLTCTCVLLGCFSNIYSLARMKNLKLGQTLKSYLSVLAVWDTCVLVSSLHYYGLVALFQLQPSEILRDKSAGIWPYLLVIFHGPLTTAITGSTWTIVLIACARHKAIFKPLHSRNSHISQLKYCVCFGTAISAILYCLPTYFEVRIAACLRDDVTDEEGVQVWPRDLMVNPKYQLIYRTIMYAIFITLGPFIIVLLLSIHMMILLNRRNANYNLLGRTDSPHTYRKRSTENRRIKSNKRTGFIMVLLLAKFLSCNLPATIVMLCLSIDKASFKLTWVRDLADVGNFLIILNSATNSLMYGLWSKTRQKGIFRMHLSTKLSMETQVTTNTISMFDSSETATLARVWNRIHPSLFTRMMLHLADGNANLAQKLGLDTGESEILKRVSQNQYEFFDSIIAGLQQNPTDFPSARIQHVGQMHCRLGIRMSNQQLRRMKTFMLTEICNSRASIVAELLTGPGRSVRGSELRVWNSFISLVIADMKFGFLLAKTNL